MPDDALAGADEEFGAWGWRRHALALALLAALIVAGWHSVLLRPTAGIDEAVYLRAFAHVAAGDSPYLEPIYLYPPPLAHAGAALWRHLGDGGILSLLRALNVAGLVACLWLSTAFWPLPYPHRLIAASALVWTPGAALGLTWGNLSLGALGLLAIGLRLAWRRPVLAGLCCAAAGLLKPLAPPAVATLALHRPDGGGPLAFERRTLAMAAIAGVATLLAIAASSYWRDLLALADFREHTTRSLSTRRLLVSAGLGEVNALLLALAAMALLAWLARRRPLDRIDATLVATVAVVLTMPILWVHTLLITLPLQGAALALAVRRRHLGLARWPELLLVILAVASQHAGNGIDGASGLPILLPVAIAVPLLAPLGLFLYLRAVRPT